MRRLRNLQRQWRVAGARQHLAEIDVARLVVRSVRVGEVRGQYADPLPVQQQRLLMDTKNILEHTVCSSRDTSSKSCANPRSLQIIGLAVRNWARSARQKRGGVFSRHDRRTACGKELPPAAPAAAMPTAPRRPVAAGRTVPLS